MKTIKKKTLQERLDKEAIKNLKRQNRLLQLQQYKNTVASFLGEVIANSIIAYQNETEEDN